MSKRRSSSAAAMSAGLRLGCPEASACERDKVKKNHQRRPQDVSMPFWHGRSSARDGQRLRQWFPQAEKLTVAPQARKLPGNEQIAARRLGTNHRSVFSNREPRDVRRRRHCVRCQPARQRAMPCENLEQTQRGPRVPCVQRTQRQACARPLAKREVVRCVGDERHVLRSLRLCSILHRRWRQRPVLVLRAHSMRFLGPVMGPSTDGAESHARGRPICAFARQRCIF